MTAVSVIIPVYNVEKYLRRCLDTVIAQTFGLDYEIICVDDGSTDLSAQILKEYDEKYPGKFKIIRQENKGLSEARNSALKYVGGKYIMYVDSDDFIANNALELLYDYAEKHNSEVVVFDFLKGEQGQNTFKRVHYPKLEYKYADESFNAQTAHAAIYTEIAVGVWSKFYLADFVQKIKFLPGVIYEDVAYWTEVFAKAKRINYLPVPLYFYVENRINSLTADNSRKVFDVFKIFDVTGKVLQETGLFKKYRDYYYILFASWILGAVKKMHIDLRKEYIQAIKEYAMNINYDKILNGDFYKYQKEDIYFIKHVKENDYKTVENFCYDKRIWRGI